MEDIGIKWTVSKIGDVHYRTETARSKVLQGFRTYVKGIDMMFIQFQRTIFMEAGEKIGLVYERTFS